MSLALLQWRRSRPLDVTSSQALAISYRREFFIGVGLAEAPALVGFVTTFIAGALWPYLIGLSFAVIGLFLVGPSKREIARRQAQIQAQGSPLSLGRALMETPSSG